MSQDVYKRQVPGCVSNGIPEQVGLQIYAEMMDFAKYAFNKSHAACYAAVSYTHLPGTSIKKG